MFGYIRPLKAELKVREYEQYKSCYCALCHTLHERYGWISRFVLNYDFTFLAMLLWQSEDEPEYRCARCTASPFKKKTYCVSVHALEICAANSVILSWWKLKDNINDEGFIKTLRDRLLLILLRKAYKKAARDNPAFEENVRLSLEELRALEKTDSSSLDACADKFAKITALAAETAGDARYRPLAQLLYHTGRFIYIIDACDDLQEDWRSGSFNPVARRFNIDNGKLTDAHIKELQTTLMHSCAIISAAYELLPENTWSPVTRNIIYLGMPSVATQVLDGTWKKARTEKGNG